MSLDLVILKYDKDKKTETVDTSTSIDVDVHWEIITEAERLKLSLFLRLKDYYEASIILWVEIASFLNSLDELLILQYKNDAAVKKNLNEIKKIALIAKEYGKSLIAIPD